MMRAHRRLCALHGQLAPKGCSATADKITFEPLPGLSFGARVHGCNVDQDMDDPEACAKVRAAWLEYGLLVFPPQLNPDGSLLTQEQQQKFVTRFGQLDHSVVITNVRKNGALLQDTKADRSGAVLHSTEGWHSDATFLSVSMKAGCIYAELMPETGGETEIADMASGYDTLDDATKAKIADLKAYHSLEIANVRRSGHFPNPNTGKVGSDQLGSIFDGQAYLRPLVKTHPETGKRMLLAPIHAFGILGMDKAESTQLLDDLVDHACQNPRVHTQKWVPGEIMFWDQRRCFHRARPYAGARRIRSHRLKGDLGTSDESLPDPTEGREAYQAEVAWLNQIRPWEDPNRPTSKRGGFYMTYKD